MSVYVRARFADRASLSVMNDSDRLVLDLGVVGAVVGIGIGT